MCGEESRGHALVLAEALQPRCHIYLRFILLEINIIYCIYDLNMDGGGLAVASDVSPRSKLCRPALPLPTAVEPTWNTYASQGQILALGAKVR